MHANRFLPLAGFLAGSFGAAAIGSIATFSSVNTWYRTLLKPAWNPPNWLFSPVWTLLYVLMAVATWRVWRAGGSERTRQTIIWYALQLALNALWSVLFFGLRRPDLALIEITLLWAVLVVIWLRSWRIDRTGGMLWSPYVAWVAFATALNGAIWSLNR